MWKANDVDERQHTSLFLMAKDCRWD